MISYTPLQSFLVKVPKVLRSESDEADLLYYGREAYKELRIPSTNETKIQIVKLVDHKAQLPTGAKQVNLVTYMCSDPSEVDLESLKGCSIDSSTTVDTYPENSIYSSVTNDNGVIIGAYTLAHSLFIQSSFYNRCCTPLKYVGMNNAICPTYGISKHAPCANTFTIAYDGVITSNLKEGYLFIDYDVDLKDEEGNYLIIDEPEVKEYLARAAIVKVLESRTYSSEQGTVHILDREIQKLNTAFTRVKGILLLRGINRKAIGEVTNNTKAAQSLTTLPKSFLDAQ